VREAQQTRRKQPDFLRAAVAGAAGAVVGTLAMNYAQRLWTLAIDGRAPASAADEHDARDWQERSEHQNANELAAQALATATIRRPLTSRELSIAARIIHFAFGAAVGAVHGVYATRHPKYRTGAALGIVLWCGADEIAMPVLGLSQSTLRRPLDMHLQSFVAHIVYGVTTEHARRLVSAGAPAVDATLY
jgi:putative membrane protein